MKRAIFPQDSISAVYANIHALAPGAIGVFINAVVAMTIQMVIALMHLVPDAHGIMTKDKHIAVIIEFHYVRHRTERIPIFFDLAIVVTYYMMQLPANNTVSHFWDACMIFEYKIS